MLSSRGAGTRPRGEWTRRDFLHTGAAATASVGLTLAKATESPFKPRSDEVEIAKDEKKDGKPAREPEVKAGQGESVAGPGPGATSPAADRKSAATSRPAKAAATANPNGTRTSARTDSASSRCCSSSATR